MWHLSQAQRIVISLPPHDILYAVLRNNLTFRIDRTQAAGGVCEQRIPALRYYKYIDCIHGGNKNF